VVAHLEWPLMMYVLVRAGFCGVSLLRRFVGALNRRAVTPDR
jgi:hypothetical protein